MRVVLLLHPDYSFPHILESFPLEAYFNHWLEQSKENHLIIIGKSHFKRPVKHAEKILYYPLAHKHTTSYLSAFRFKWKVFRLLKKTSAERILLHDSHTYSFFFEKGWISLFFQRLVKNNFLILQHEDGIPSTPVDRSNAIHIPDMPASGYDNKDEKRHDLIKEKYTSGAEYFLCSASFTTPQQLTTLLKAYSIFKHRFKTNYKLVLSGICRQDKRFTSLLSHYKYRDDVVLFSEGEGFSFSDLLAAAYVHIYTSFDLYYPCSRADCAIRKVPVIYPVAQKESVQSAGLTFIAKDMQDLAQKMMLIYKDEAARKQIIQNMYEYFQHPYKSFDFSSYL